MGNSNPKPTATSAHSYPSLLRPINSPLDIANLTDTCLIQLNSVQSTDQMRSTLGRLHQLVTQEATKLTALNTVGTEPMLKRLFELTVASEKVTAQNAMLAILTIHALIVPKRDLAFKVGGARTIVKALSVALSNLDKERGSALSSIGPACAIMVELIETETSVAIFMETRAWVPVTQALHAHQWDPNSLQALALLLFILTRHEGFDWSLRDERMESAIFIIQNLPVISLSAYRMVGLLVGPADPTKKYDKKLDRVVPSICKQMATADVIHLNELCRVSHALALNAATYLEQESKESLLLALSQHYRHPDDISRQNVYSISVALLAIRTITEPIMNSYMRLGLLDSIIEALKAEETEANLAWICGAALILISISGKMHFDYMTRIPGFINGYAKVLVNVDPGDFGAATNALYVILRDSPRIPRSDLSSDFTDLSSLNPNVAYLQAVLREPIEKILAVQPTHPIIALKELLSLAGMPSSI